MWLWIAAALMLIGAGVLFAKMQSNRPPARVTRRFEETLRNSGIHITTPPSLFGNSQNNWLIKRLERFSSSEIEEMQRVLAVAGWGSVRTRLYFLIGGWLGPIAAAFMTGTTMLAQEQPASKILLYMLFVFALVFVSLRRFLRWRAKERQKAIRREIVPLLHLLRMLFDAGLSFEHTLQVIEQQGRPLIPNLTAELSSVLKRIQAGQDRGEALAEMAAPLEVPELSDTVAMLKQVTRYGGNVREALVEYTKLVEQRQVAELREYVSKLSAKMTIVMSVFLFPALMIFVAGPGFVGLAKALQSVGG